MNESNTSSLQSVANQLLATPLFTGNTDLDRLTSKQMIFLVAAGMKPLSEVASLHFEETERGKEAKGDDPEAVKAFLGTIGLSSSVEAGEAITRAVVSNNPEIISDFTDKKKPEGKLFGFPESSIEAFESGSSMGIEEQEKLQAEAGIPESFTPFRLSMDNYEEELKLMKSWYQLLEQYTLV